MPTGVVLGNLANILHTQPGRQDEARELAEEALAIKKTMDPGAAQMWKTHNVLAEIADQQSQRDRAAEYRRLARPFPLSTEKGKLQSCSAQDLRMFMSWLTSISGDLDGTNGKASGETAETR